MKTDAFLKAFDSLYVSEVANGFFAFQHEHPRGPKHMVLSAATHVRKLPVCPCVIGPSQRREQHGAICVATRSSSHYQPASVIAKAPFLLLGSCLKSEIPLTFANA